MNIIVTGATSFIGVPMIEQLLKMGHQVFAVMRPGSAHAARLAVQSPDLHRIEIEMKEFDQLAEKIDVRCHVFLHFGWDGSGSRNRSLRDVQQSNVAGSLKALEGAARTGCRRFIFSGSQAEYGICQEAMTEDLLCNPISEYGKAKVDFYHRAAQKCSQWKLENRYEMEYIHARIFSIYGPGDHPWSLVESCLRAFQADQSISLGECTQQWNFLYIEDLIQALLALVFSEIRFEAAQPAAIFNIAGSAGETRPLRQYVEAMHQICKKKGSYVYGDRLAHAEGPANLIPDITKIREQTGWEPRISFEEGIKRML